MPLTQIEFKEHDTLFQPFAEGISQIIDKHTGKKATFEGKRLNDGNCKEKGYYRYDHYRIEFDEYIKTTLKVEVVGNRTSDFDLNKTNEVYQELVEYSKWYLKTNNINIFLSVALIHFSMKEVSSDLYYGTDTFIDPEDGIKAIPMTDELKKIQDVAWFMKEYFPIKHNGKVIETGFNKFRKEYKFRVTNENGSAKIGIFLDDLVATVQTEKEVLDLVELKRTKMVELEKVKQDAIKTLKTIDPTFEYDGKNGVVLLGKKATINTEYDPFKKEYLMVFIKSKIKAQTLTELNEKIDAFIVKKTS